MDSRKKPQEYKHRIDQIIALLSPNVDSTNQALDILEALITKTHELVKNR